MDEEAFLDEIRGAADEMTPRLIFADWLEEQGDPRAEWIRMQCGAAPGVAHVPQQQQRQKCLSQLRSLGVKDVRFHWGFVDKVLIEGSEFLKRPGALLRAAPTLRGLMLRGIKVAEATHVIRQLVALRKLQSLESLDLTGCGLGASALAELNCAAFRLRRLNLRGNFVGGEGMSTLCQVPTLQDLEYLNVSSTGVRVHDVRVLSFSRQLPNLLSLQLDENQIGDGGLRRLSFAHNMHGLSALHLAENDIGVGGLRSWADGEALSRLDTLDLSGNHIGESGCAIIASTSHASPLRSLGLAQAELGSTDLRTLADSSYLQRVRQLNVSGNEFTDAFSALATGFTHLDSLDLSQTGVRDDDLACLGRVHGWPQLSCLDLGRNPISDRGLAYLLDSPLAAQLTQLRLADTSVSSTGWKTLAASQLPQLQILHARGCPQPALHDLRARFGAGLQA